MNDCASRPRRDGVLQRLDDAALADDVFETLRTPLAGESEVDMDNRS